MAKKQKVDMSALHRKDEALSARTSKKVRKAETKCSCFRCDAAIAAGDRAERSNIKQIEDGKPVKVEIQLCDACRQVSY